MIQKILPFLAFATAGYAAETACPVLPKAEPGVAGKPLPNEKSDRPYDQFQYLAEGIKVPAATADEAKVAAFDAGSIRAARKYLDDGAHYWVREKSCVACHTSGVYMVERPILTPQLGAPSEEVLADFVQSIPTKPGGGANKNVWRSSGLAAWDKHVTGKLSDHTDKSLRHMLTCMEANGSYKPIAQVEIPYITTHFELSVQAARAIATAPGWLESVKDESTINQLSKMQTFLREHQPVNDYELALKLQLSSLLPDLVSTEHKAAAIAMLWRQQLADGGWSTRRMSDVMKWHEKMDPLVVEMIQKEPDAAAPDSDPYMTSWAVVLLRESGTPTDDPRIQKAIGWLKRNQRVSGRWWMKSLFRDTYHYSTYISTAQALRALALCGEIPDLGEDAAGGR